LLFLPQAIHKTNLRFTRQTELTESFPAHVVCGWMGNSERVAQGHYLQVIEDHLQRRSVVSRIQIKKIRTTGAMAEKAKKVVQKAVQQVQILPRNTPHHNFRETL
jgi:hypothetical protein